MSGECFDVVVIGGGHAGVEAALAASRLSKRTAMLCTERGTVSLMACNPAIGGTAKGHLVREVDALGGEMGLAADKALLQIKMLNTAKGPAVFSLRGQEDKLEYQNVIARALDSRENLTVIEDEAVEIEVDGGQIKAVITAGGRKLVCKTAILATGVYLNAELIIGDYVKKSGPSGYKSADRLTESLVKAGIPMRRFKTGTPARIYRDSIDFSKMQIQRGGCGERFSFMSDVDTFEEEACYLTYTNEETHKIILENIDRSPLYNGSITGVGPRYCPSIETKVMRFADKSRHQIFVEPEGKGSDEMYIQGMSSSLPHDVQEKMYRTVAGLENCRFAKYAYAIEYDCLNPLCLKPSLEIKGIKGLFSAGQMNGSSGYEEAAAQGIMSGINASLLIDGKAPFVLGRDEAYIGVLIDDLVTKGTEEPYRMMTARAEHRIMLRQDNADIRLTEKSYELGLASIERVERMRARKAQIESIKANAGRTVDKETVSRVFSEKGLEVPKKIPTFAELCRRPELDYEDLEEFAPEDAQRSAVEAAIVELKYEGYLKKQESAVKEQRRMENKILPADMDYGDIRALRLEARQKLNEIRPLNLGQASRISGVSPADIAALIVYLQQNGK